MDCGSKLGERIRSARKDRGLTIRETADIIDCSPTAFNRLEKGERGLNYLSFSQIAKLSQELRIPVDELFNLAVEYEAKRD